jgi:hypothetical protein
MASTRNINSKRNYSCEQDIFKNIQNYQTYTNSAYGEASTTNLPCLGFGAAAIPREKLAHNPVEIESSLFGIGSTNLVVEQQPITPQLKCLQHKSIVDKIPFIMPEPLVVEKNQRPRPLN